jgi:hypothetical protein
MEGEAIDTLPPSDWHGLDHNDILDEDRHRDGPCEKDSLGGKGSVVAMGASVRDLHATVNCIECMQTILANKMSQNIPNNYDFSSAILKQLSRVRTLMNSDGPALDITRTLVKVNFIELILNNVTSMLRYENVTEECLRVLAPLTRICGSGASDWEDSTLRFQREIMYVMFRSGGVVFSLLALRGYMNTSLGIRLQGLEVLSALLEFAALSPATQLVDAAENAELQSQRYGSSPKKLAASHSAHFDYQSNVGIDRAISAFEKNLYGAPEARHSLLHLTSLPSNSLSQDSVHQLLLHGAGVVLVRMLQFSVSAASEVSIRRSIWCLRFLVLDTPASLACKIASYNQFACLTALATQLCASSEAIRMEAATLLTAMLSSHVDVAVALTQKGAWNDLSSVLARCAEHISVPSHWLSGSLENIRKLSQVEVGSMSLKQHQTTHGIRNNGADDVSAIETALVSHKTYQIEKGGELINEGSTIEDVVATLLQKNRQSARERSERWSRQSSRNMGRPSSRNDLDRSQSHRQIFGSTMEDDGLIDAVQSSPNLLTVVKSHSKAKFDIRTSKFAKHIMESPLGEPVDPVLRRKILKENNGTLPLHVPFALGGPKLGSRPGPDHGSKKNHKLSKESDSRQGQILSPNPNEASNDTTAKKSAQRFPGLIVSDDLLPSVGNIDERVEAEKRTTIKVARQAKFLASKLFDDKPASTVSNEESTAISKLNFAERLQCMIMQVQDLS